MTKLSTILKLSICLFVLCSWATTLHAKDLDLQFVQAAKEGNLKKVQSCLKQKVDVNTQVDAGYFKSTTALMLAAREGHLKIVKLLLNKKADVKLKSKKGMTALSTALMGNQSVIGTQLAIVKLLLGKGADANDTFMGMTMLGLSIRQKVEIVELLLDNGAKIDAKDDEGKTAFASAVPYNNYAVIKLFIDRGAKADFNAALMRAVSAPEPSAKIVNLLIAQGADVNYKDKSGTPLFVKAADRDSVEIIKILLKKGADINATDEYYNRTALFKAAGYGYVEVVKELIKQGADLNLKDKHNLTALSTKKSEVIKLLKKAGAK